MQMKNLFIQWGINFIRMKYLFLSAILVILTLGACHKKSTPDQATKFELTDSMMKRISFDTVKIRKVTGTLLLNGRITTDKSKMVEIFPIVGGTAIQVNAELGDYKNKGDVLAVIRSGEVAEYNRQMIDAQSNVLVAEKKLTVQQDMFNSKLISEKELIEAQQELDKSNAELNRVKEVFKIYHLSKNAEYVIKTPISGFVIEKNLNMDMTIRSDDPDHLFTIAEIDKVWVMAQVFESDISKVKVGMDAEVTTLSYPEKKFKGKVDKIFNILDPDTKTMSVRITLDNADYMLKPEMIANVKLRLEENDQSPAIPASSVIFDKNKYFVMVYHDRKNIETREINLYKSTDDFAYILTGLKPGEIIISKNQLYVYDELND